MTNADKQFFQYWKLSRKCYATVTFVHWAQCYNIKNSNIIILKTERSILKQFFTQLCPSYYYILTNFTEISDLNRFAAKLP